MQTIHDFIRQWAAARDVAAEADISAIDQAGAERIGLPVLAALYALQQRLESANGRIAPAEMLAELRPVIGLARGEAESRAARCGEQIRLPGLVDRPTTLLLEDLLP